ncbi:MAG: Smr/MutS family protein [Candidatus Deferrimicrobiota bacterium]
MSGPRRIPIEDRIDLHAFLPRETSRLLEDYLEEAVRAGFRQVRIVHGRGTGTQRQTVRAVLSRHPAVEAFADAPPEAGGWGATVATLRPRGDATSGR